MKFIVLVTLACLKITFSYAQKSFGFLYENAGKQTVVKSVFKNGPAAKAGIQKDDVLISLNSISLTGLNLEEVSKLFAVANDNSSLSFKRNSTDAKSVKIIKAERSSFLNVCVSGDCQNGEGEFIDMDGYQYNGSFKNGIKTGYGKMAYFDKKIYTGNWANNKPEGKGKDVLKNGDTYEGNFANGFYHGEGTYTTSAGETYTGIYKRGIFDGIVTHFLKSSNETYTEIYKDGVFVSSKKIEKQIPPSTNPGAKFETITYTNGDMYEGYTVNKSKEGFGKYTYKNGSFYEGNWANDKMNGLGKYNNGFNDANGIVYEGYRKDNLKDGKGKETTANGTVTEQNWIAGKLNGKSVSTVYEKQSLLFTIEQEYTDDKKIGNPKVTYPDGNIYEGEWQYGTPYGMGRFIYKNGDIEKGNFWRGQKVGLIEFTAKKAKPVTQYYLYNKIAGNYKNGELIYTNGDKYEGLWKDGLQEGAGKLTTKLETITGNWKRGFLEGVAIGTSKADGSVTTYGYKEGKIVSESLNPKKFTAQIIKLVANSENKFSDIVLDNNDGIYPVSEKLNGFAECVVNMYPSHISSTGKEQWVYKAETVRMSKDEALAMCSKIESAFEQIKFSVPAKKEIAYNVATRRLVNYEFNDKLPIVNVDALGETWWVLTIRINK